MSALDPLRIAFAASLLVCSTAQAQLFRSYLASDGNDANPCTLQAPCRLLPAALNAVAGGGEIWMLDSANYNTATVTVGKSVSILAVPGAVGSVVTLNGGPAISITAAGLRVALRNLVIGRVAGVTLGTHGVEMTGASTLTIENTLITDVPLNGVRVVGSGTLRVANSVLRNGFGGQAIYLRNGANASITETHMVAHGGVYVYGNAGGTVTTASISDSFISGSTIGNVTATTDAADAIARVAVTRTTIERSGTGALTATTNGNGTATVVVSGSTIAGNNTAWNQDGTGSSIVSLGNNHITNYNFTTGTITQIAMQ